MAFLKYSLICLMLWQTTAQAQSEWPYKSYDHVKAYLFNADAEYIPTILKPDSSLHESVIGEGVKLNKKQERIVLDLINKNDLETISALIQGLAKCYSPHHALVFYDKENRPVASLSFCFYCSGIRIYPSIPALAKLKIDYGSRTDEEWQKFNAHAEAELNKLKKVMEALDLPVYDDMADYKKLK